MVSKAEPFVEFLYLESVHSEDEEYCSKLADFINQNHILHFCVPLGNPKSSKWTSLDRGADSPIIKFLLKIQSAKISAHPFDGYGKKNAFVFEGSAAGDDDPKTAIRIVMSYIKTANKILNNANKNAKKITGIVLGEGLGCPPFRNDEETSLLYRRIINESGFDDTFTIGGSNGTNYINQRYYQMYDWTNYDENNINPWKEYRNRPSHLLNFFLLMKEGLSNAAQLHRNDPANYYGNPGAWHDEHGKFWWQKDKHQKPGINFHWMFASRPDRLGMWSLDKVRELFSLIRKQIRDSGHSAGIALYGHGKPLPWLVAHRPKAHAEEESDESESDEEKKQSESDEEKKQSESDEENEDSESNGDSDSDSNDEELIGVFDKNHKIYYRESTREFFVRKHSKELSEKHALKMIGQMEEKDSGFREKMREFKKKKGL